MASDSPLASLLGLLTEPAFVVTLEGRVVASNGAADRAFGSVSTLAERAVDPDGVEALLKTWRRSSSPSPGTLALETGTGPASFRVDGARVAGDDGTPLLMVRLRLGRRSSGAFSALTDRVKQLGLEVGRRQRAESQLAWQVRLLALIAGGGALEEALDGIARFVEAESDEGAYASILLVQDGRLRHGAAPSLPREYVAAIDGVEIGPSVGSCGTAAYLREPVTVTDIASDPLWSEFGDLALAHGLRACWSVPVQLRDGEVVATVAHYDRRPRAPTAEDAHLAEVASYLVGIALERHLREQALRERAAELLEVNERTQEFLAMLGHELRNPLAPMAATLELMSSNGGTDDERVRWLEVMNRHLAVVRRHVDDLLDISRVTKGKLTLRKTPIDVRGVVESVCAADVAEQRVILEMSGDAVWVNGDHERLEQVFGNLLHNAKKFSPPDSPITVAVGRDGDEAVVSVRDRGAGIDETQMNRIFELFGQGDTSVDRAQGGLGIGLTLAQTLTKRHGGSIEARSEGLGHGSEFIVRVPVCEAPATAPVAAPTDDSQTRDLSILVVDDNEDAADLLARLLRRWGHRTRVAYDGAEALEAATEQSWDMIILDIGLPLIDGFEVARVLRKKPALGPEACTLVALTGYGQARDRERAKASGFDEFFVKPVDLPRLKRLMAERGQRPASGA